MNSKHTNPNANVPEQRSDEPLGDRGQGDKTWSPDQGTQGISNRPDDQDEDQHDSADHVERGGEVHADTADKWSDDDNARQEQGLPNSSTRRQSGGA